MAHQRPDNYDEVSPPSAELFHLIVENIKDYAIFMTDAEGRVASWNPGVEKVLGYNEREIVGQSIAIIFTPEDAAAGEHVKEMERAANTGCSEDKRWHQRKDGSLFWANGMVMSVKNDDGTLRGFAKVMRDDTTHKMLEESLRESEEFNRNILESSVDCVKVLDLDGKLLSMNTPGLRIMEIDDFGDFQGRHWADFWSGEECEKAVSAVDSARRGEIGRFRGFAETAKGTGKYWDVIVSPMLDRNGKPKQILSVSRDITGQKRNEEALAKSNRRAEKILESITDAFFTLDHDWRFTYLNKQSESLLRRKRVELLGKNIWDEFPEAVGTRFYDQYHKAVAEQMTIIFEEFYSPFDAWFEVRAFPSPNGISVYFHNINERKRDEQLLIERERLATLNSELSLALIQSASLSGILQSCTEVIVKHMDAAFARIWTLNDEENILELRASAGIYTHLDGEHSRIPVGKYKIGLIAEERKPHLTNSVAGDSRVSDQEWAKREGMVAFAGYPLIIGARLIGVVAMFARHPLGLDALKAIESAANIIALGIERKRSQESLKNQKTLLEGLTESVLDGILIVSTEGKMLHFNQHFLNIWNFPPEITELRSDEAALLWAANQTANPAAFLARVGSVYEQPNTKVREELPMKDGRVFERFGAPILSGDTRLGWVWTFRDITERKRIETNFAFLAEISQDLAGLTEAREITQVVTDKIGKYLGASNCVFAEVDTAANTAIVNFCWCKDEGAVDLVGNYQLSEFVSDEFRQTLIARKPVIVKDVATDSRTAENLTNFELLKIGSFINTPYVSDGLLRFVLGVYRSEPYEWRADEIELLGELMTRVWTRIERARAEEKLHESEERFSKAFNASPLVLTISSLTTGELIEVNETFVTATGYTREEAVGKTTLELGLWKKPTDREAEMEIVRQAGQLSNAEYTFRTKSGAEIIGLLAAERIEIGGEPFTLSVIQDITERKMVEEKIRESEESYRILAETASDAIIRIDENSTIQYVNTAAELIFGYAEEEMIGQSLMMLMPEELRERHCAGMGNYLKTGKRNLNWKSIEVPARHKDGRHFPLEISFGEYNRGDRRFFIGIARDITTRRKAEEDLRESEERLRALADSIPQLAWMAEPDGFIFWYNRRWYDYTGATSKEMEGWGWQSVHDAEMLPIVMERWQASIQTGEPFEMEFPLRRGADGAFRWFLTRVVPLRDTGGRIVRWFGTNTDIEELRQARLQAEQANRLKDEFLATLSHELRTPLNAILGWSQMLQTHNLGESEAKKALATIERNARAQNQLIDDLLDVSRIITGKLRLDVRAVDLSSIITLAIDAARPGADAKNIRLQPLLDPQAGPISGDSDRLQQIIWNLLSNAIKFTPKGGRVQVRLERVNSHVEIVISDTGAGIEPEFLPHVFDRFRQSDGSMTRRHGGLGLGLAIVRQLVELHGGTVSVSSGGEGQGATFTVNLPLLPVRREPLSDVPRVHPKAEIGGGMDCPPELSDLRVLLVDDEADSRDLLNLVLNSCGARVTTVSSAAEAFETAKREKFDVIVSDIGMPEEDGFSLIAKIRSLTNEQGGNTPAIALTAYARAEDRVQALRSGFQMHVAKPVEPSELVTVVANLAGRMRNPQRNENT